MVMSGYLSEYQIGVWSCSWSHVPVRVRNWW